MNYGEGLRRVLKGRVGGGAPRTAKYLGTLLLCFTRLLARSIRNSFGESTGNVRLKGRVIANTVRRCNI